MTLGGRIFPLMVALGCGLLGPYGMPSWAAAPQDINFSDAGVRETPAQLVAETTAPEIAPVLAWPEPTALLEQIAEMESHSHTRQWAQTTAEIIESILREDTTALVRRQDLVRLAHHTEQLRELNEQLSRVQMPRVTALQLSSQISRIHYRLRRRIDIWDLLAQMPISASLTDHQVPVHSAAMSNIRFEGLPPTWVKYLLLDEFQSAFGSLQPDPKEQKLTARRILARMHSPVLTPEQATYLQDVVDPHVVAFLRDHASDPVDHVDLLKRIEYYEEKSSAAAGAYLNNRYQDLLWSTRAEDRAVAAALEAHYRNANFRMVIAESFMNRLLPELPTIAEPVAETVQGSYVTGQSEIRNQLQVKLVPDPAALNLQLRTIGEVQSDTVARRGGVHILNQGEARFQVLKQVTVNERGIDASRPAYTVSSANQFLVGIQSKMDNVPVFGNVARKIAEKKVREMSPETDQIFRSKVARQAEDRVEEELAKQVAKVRQAANEKLFHPLVEMELEPEPLQLATTENQVVIRYRLAGRDQMAANTSRPRDNGYSLISFQVHQSLINNGIARLGLNGKTFTSQQLRDHLQSLFSLPADTFKEIDPSQPEAEFTFATHDPIQIQFVDDRVLISLNLASLKVGDRGTKWRNVTMQAAYEVDTDRLNVKLTQDDNGTRIDGRKLRVADRAGISTVMKVLFDQHYSFSALPPQFKEHQPAQQLHVSQLVISDGWLGVSLDDPPTAQAQQTPARFGNFKRMLDR